MAGLPRCLARALCTLLLATGGSVAFAANTSAIPPCRLDDSAKALVASTLARAAAAFKELGKPLPFDDIRVNEPAAPGKRTLVAYVVADANADAVSPQGCTKGSVKSDQPLDAISVLGGCVLVAVDRMEIRCSATAIRIFGDVGQKPDRANPSLLYVLSHELGHLYQRRVGEYSGRAERIDLKRDRASKLKDLQDSCDPTSTQKEDEADAVAVEVLTRTLSKSPYYQPRLALDFAKRLIAEGYGDSSSVCNMLRNAAYTYDHLEEACKLLWLAGRGDARALHQQPGHGIRILKELAEFEPNKPVDYVQAVVRFALDLLERPASLKFTYTPFAILEGPLGTEMETTTSSRMTMTIHRYQLPLTVAQEVRDEVTSSLLRFMREGPPRRAFLAAQTMSEALRGPMHGDTSDGAWSREHQKLLRAMLEALKSADISPVVLVRAAQSASWHAFYGPAQTRPDAHAILELLNRDLPTRLVRALVDGWGTDTWELSEALEREAHVADRARLTQELRDAFPAVSELSELLEMWMAEIASVAGSGYGAPFLLVNHLLENVSGFAIDVIERSNDSQESRLADYVGKALSVVIAADDTSLVDEFLLLSRDSVPVLRQVSEAYARFESNRAYRPSEIELFKRIFQSKDELVGRHAASLVQQVAKRSPALAVELVCEVDLEAHPRAIHDMFMWLSSENTIPPNELRSRRRELLKKLLPLPKLEDHWVLKFLSSSTMEDAPAVVELVQERLKEASRRKDWAYTPLRKEHRGDGVGLLSAPNGPRLLRDLLDWGLVEATDHASIRRLGEAIAGLCGRFEKTLFEVLLSFMSTPSSERATLVAAVLRHAQNDFIYESPTFIREVLNAAELVGQDALDDLHAAIVVATRSGMRGGVVGQPFPEDVKLEQHASQMLATLSRADPAYDVYDDLLRDARDSISRQEKSRTAMEDDEIDAE